jgi:methylmalonyl-CoA mutase
MAEVYNSLIHDKDNQIKIEPFKYYRLSSEFEELKFNSINYKYLNGKFPDLPLICIGKLKEYKIRADFSNDFFKVGGFDCFIIDGFEDSENISIDNIPEKKAYVFCSTDDLYAQFIPTFAKKLKDKYPDSYTILAGYPKDRIDEYKNAGIDDFIHIKSNLLESLTKLQEIYNLLPEEGAN